MRRKVVQTGRGDIVVTHYSGFYGIRARTTSIVVVTDDIVGRFGLNNEANRLDLEIVFCPGGLNKISKDHTPIWISPSESRRDGQGCGQECMFGAVAELLVSVFERPQPSPSTVPQEVLVTTV